MTLKQTPDVSGRRKPTAAPLGKGEPVTVLEVSSAVLKALAAEFGHRVLDCDTARHGLAHASFTLIQMHLKEVSESGG